MDMFKFLFKNRDRIVSVFTFILGILWLQGAQNIRPPLNTFSESEPGSRLFPILVGILIVVTSIGKFITCNQEDESEFYGKTGAVKILKVMFILGLYVFLMKYFGYIICTFLASMALLYTMKEDRPMKWFTPIIFAALFTFATYMLFGKILMVRLPMGSIIKTIVRSL